MAVGALPQTFGRSAGPRPKSSCTGPARAILPRHSGRDLLSARRSGNGDRVDEAMPENAGCQRRLLPAATGAFRERRSESGTGGGVSRAAAPLLALLLFRTDDVTGRHQLGRA